VNRACVLVLLSALGVLSAMGTGGGGGGDASTGIGSGLRCIFDNPPINLLPEGNAYLDTLYVSNGVNTKGMCDPKTAEISPPGEYSVNGGAWMTSRTQIRPGDSVRVRVRSAITFETTTSTTLTIGTLQAGGTFNPWDHSSGTFRVTTRAGRPEDAPVAVILSPADQQVVDGRTIVVLGSADDPDGIQEITVNGQLADTDDGFNTWQAEIPLVTGPNTITVATADTWLNRNPQAAVIEIDNVAIVLQEPSAMATDQINDQLLVVDRGFGGVVSIDLQTDVHTLLSPETAGVQLLTPHRIAVSPARNRAWVIDDGYEDLIEVDLTTGNRSLLSGPGDPLTDARDLAIDDARNHVLVMRSRLSTNNDDTQIYAVDMSTGARDVLSDNVTPDAVNPFRYTRSIVFDVAGDQLIVPQDHAAVCAVDPDLGTRAIFLDERAGSVVSAVNDPVAARILMANRFSSVIEELPLVGGSIQFLWSTRYEPAQIALDGKNQRLLVLYVRRTGIAAIDLNTGALTNVY